jgi:hypothetical protein
MDDRNPAVNVPPFPLGHRSSGVLLHVTSLPSPYGIGDVGPGSFGWELSALARARRDLAGDIDQIRFAQFLLNRQGCRLKAYARARGIRLIGNLPFFVSLDSSDVWGHFAKAGIDIDTPAIQLQGEGARSFVKSWNELMTVIASKSAVLKKASREACLHS